MKAKKTISQDTSDCFNKHFTNIADKIRNKILPSNKHYSDFLKNRNPNSFFFSPVDKNEIIKVIKTLNITKSNSPNSIPSNLLVTAN